MVVIALSILFLIVVTGLIALIAVKVENRVHDRPRPGERADGR